MRILVTGVSGQVGGALAHRLQPFGTVVPADRAVLDLSRPDAVAAGLGRLAPALIVNAAAYTAVDKAEDEPALAMAVNSQSPGVMAGWAATRAVPLIHFSTDYVFDGSGERPWREDDIPRPLSVYGSSKLGGEIEIRGARGCALILRTSWVYAAQGKNFPRTIAALARARTELRIVADQIGAPTPAGLIADAVAGIVAGGPESLRQHCAQAGGLVHFAASGATSWHEFAGAVVDGLRARGRALAVEHLVPIRSEEYPTRAERPRNSRLDLGRWQQVFGQTPPPWRAALAPVLDEMAKAMD
jgi:dTDP-4-dehydrorhamnose reductase